MNKFLTNFLLKAYVWSKKDKIDGLSNIYQNKCRIYLDEYEGQKDLREHWFFVNVLRKKGWDGIDGSCTFTDETSNDNEFTYEKLAEIKKLCDEADKNINKYFNYLDSLSGILGDHLTIPDSADWKFSQEDLVWGWWKEENIFDIDFITKRFMEVK